MRIVEGFFDLRAEVSRGEDALSEGDELSFEAAMEEIETLVRRMESSNLPLNETLAAFERGIFLTRFCQEYLDKAQQRIEVVVASAAGVELRPFAPDREGENEPF